MLNQGVDARAEDVLAEACPADRGRALGRRQIHVVLEAGSMRYLRMTHHGTALSVRVEAEVREGRTCLTGGEVEWPLRIRHDRSAVVYCGDLACIAFKGQYVV